MTRLLPDPDAARFAEDDAWSVRRAVDLYGIEAWGGGLFGVDASGDVVVRSRPAGPSVSLRRLVDDLRRRDAHPPLVLRFTDLLHGRIDALVGCFNEAIEEMRYRGAYRPVYPIKVNQQRHVVESVLTASSSRVGLEVGSKPELLAVLAMPEAAERLIVCNGFKDRDYLRAVLLAGKLGREIVPVIERVEELATLVELAGEMSIEPALGLRVKLSSRGAGRWAESAGERSKFGLRVTEVLDAVDRLRSAGLLGCLRMVHVHIGSQVEDVSAVKRGVNELARVYAELWRAGATGLTTIDVGGGLGIDYDGSAGRGAASVNYAMQEYANNVVYHVGDVLTRAEVPHPAIVTECGRAMVAHASVLVVDVHGVAGVGEPEAGLREIDPVSLAQLPPPVQTLYESWRGIGPGNWVEYYHDSVMNRDELLSLFSLGYCTLAERALGERLFAAIRARAAREVAATSVAPNELAALPEALADTYHCNWSIFQSLPDAWAIDQVFPIVPLSRLDERPTRLGVLADVTCDSDGRVDRFIGGPTRPKGRRVLELHDVRPGERYTLGVFLVGAYQEILGDMHNLFGDTNTVHVRIGDDGEPIVEELVEGDRVDEVLRYVGYDAEDLRRSFRKSLEEAVRSGRLSLDESQALRRFYESGLAGSTYLT
ncbi:MAG: biosynthetic arginine decarboxylase [Planctomycetota bacterium]